MLCYVMLFLRKYAIFIFIKIAILIYTDVSSFVTIVINIIIAVIICQVYSVLRLSKNAKQGSGGGSVGVTSGSSDTANKGYLLDGSYVTPPRRIELGVCVCVYECGFIYLLVTQSSFLIFLFFSAHIYFI